MKNEKILDYSCMNNVSHLSQKKYNVDTNMFMFKLIIIILIQKIEIESQIFKFLF